MPIKPFTAEKASRIWKMDLTSTRKILDDLVVLVRLVKAWVTGKYSKTPWQTLVLVVATILYFVNPFDVIPDFIPVIGYVDDATMIATGIQSIRGDLKDFTRWERS